jgi:hypothetical protein
MSQPLLFSSVLTAAELVSQKRIVPRLALARHDRAESYRANVELRTVLGIRFVFESWKQE